MVVLLIEEKESVMVTAKSRASGVVLTGPLAPFGDAYRLELGTRGHTPRSVVPQLRQVGRLSRWLHGQGLTAACLDERQVEEFLALQRMDGRHRSGWSRPGLGCLLEVLRGQGVAGVCAPAPAGSGTEVLLGSFERYLFDERALATGTVCGYVGARPPVPDRGVRPGAARADGRRGHGRGARAG